MLIDIGQLAERTNSTGIITADRYLGGFAKCLSADGMCPEKLFELGDGAFDLMLKEAGGRLTYTDDRCEIVIGESELATKALGLRNKSGDIREENADIISKALAVFETVMSVTDEDRDGDYMHTKGMDVDDNMPFLWMHMQVNPIGRFLGVTQQDDKVLKGMFALAATKLGEDAATLMELKALRTSIGFTPMEGHVKPRKTATVSGQKKVMSWEVMKCKVMEDSGVSVPSCKDAVITAFSRKSLHHDGVKMWAKSFFDERPTVVAGADLEELETKQADGGPNEGDPNESCECEGKCDECKKKAEAKKKADAKKTADEAKSKKSVVELASGVLELIDDGFDKVFLDSLGDDQIEFLVKNCGTGSGGFKSGNSCAGGGSGSAGSSGGGGGAGGASGNSGKVSASSSTAFQHSDKANKAAKEAIKSGDKNKLQAAAKAHHDAMQLHSSAKSEAKKSGDKKMASQHAKMEKLHKENANNLESLAKKPKKAAPKSSDSDLADLRLANPSGSGRNGGPKGATTTTIQPKKDMESELVCKSVGDSLTHKMYGMADEYLPGSFEWVMMKIQRMAKMFLMSQGVMSEDEYGSGLVATFASECILCVGPYDKKRCYRVAYTIGENGTPAFSGAAEEVEIKAQVLAKWFQVQTKRLDWMQAPAEEITAPTAIELARQLGAKMFSEDEDATLGDAITYMAHAADVYEAHDERELFGELLDV